MGKYLVRDPGANSEEVILGDLYEFASHDEYPSRVFSHSAFEFLWIRSYEFNNILPCRGDGSTRARYADRAFEQSLVRPPKTLMCFSMFCFKSSKGRSSIGCNRSCFLKIVKSISESSICWAEGLSC